MLGSTPNRGKVSLKKTGHSATKQTLNHCRHIRFGNYTTQKQRVLLGQFQTQLR